MFCAYCPVEITDENKNHHWQNECVELKRRKEKGLSPPYTYTNCPVCDSSNTERSELELGSGIDQAHTIFTCHGCGKQFWEDWEPKEGFTLEELNDTNNSMSFSQLKKAMQIMDFQQVDFDPAIITSGTA